MQNIRQRLAAWSSEGLSAALVGVAVLTILVAIFVHSPLIKAALLAWEIVP